MKIYCFSCKNHVLEETDSFVMGGPYSGKMFNPVIKVGWAWLPGNRDYRDANLSCPKCEGQFLRNCRELLTEHGVVREGQTTIDTSQTIVAGSDHSMPGSIMRIGYSKERQYFELTCDCPEMPDTVTCPSCGKEYKNTEAGMRWYKKHVEGCPG